MAPLIAEDAVVRSLDAAERYFWLLDRLAPMNVVGVAEVERPLDGDALRRALDTVQRRHRLLRVRIRAEGDDLVFVDTGGKVPLETVETGASWTAVLADELDRPFDTFDTFDAGAAPCVRCVLIPTGDGAVLLFVAHHAVADGLGVVRVVQEVLRSVAGIPLPVAVDDPPGIHALFPPSLGKPRAVLDIASAIRAERTGLGPPGNITFHHRRAGTRRSLVHRRVLNAAAVKDLRLGARAAGATVHGALAAAMLEAVASGCPGTGPQVLCLATPTDLRRRVEPPLDEDAVMLAIGMLCTPYSVAAGDGQLAKTISEQTHREIERGESHVFYRFARAAVFQPSAEGIASFTTAFASAPQNVAVSNVGVVDDADDPPWVRSVSFALGTSNNQPAFLAATTYRGSLVLHLASDETRLDAGASDAIAAGLLDRL